MRLTTCCCVVLFVLLPQLYVSMLSHSSTEDDIRAIFTPFGALTEVILLRQKDETATSRGIAFVKYRSEHSGAVAAGGDAGLRWGNTHGA